MWPGSVQNNRSKQPSCLSMCVGEMKHIPLAVILKLKESIPSLEKCYNTEVFTSNKDKGGRKI